MKTLYVIDAFAQIFRAYHAIRGDFKSPVTQEPTNATYGWVGMLLKILREYKPDYLVIATDVSGDQGTFRSDLYPEYKANREPPPMELCNQVDRCFDIARLMNIPVIGKERYEADDVIASIVRDIENGSDDVQIRIVSKDKDLEQLLSDRCALFDVHKDLTTDVAALLEKRGIRPEHVRDMLALMGDAADNVPGVPGIGPKTAAQLMQTYGSIDSLYDNIDDLKGKRKENVEAARNSIQLSRDLVTLVDDLDTEFDLNHAIVSVNDLPVDELIDVFRTLGFHRYPDELQALTGKRATPSQQQANSESPADEAPPPGSLFAAMSGGDDELDPTDVSHLFVEPKRGTYTGVLTKEALQEVIKEVSNADRISVDTETTSLKARQAKICGISIAIESKTGWYIPIRSPEPERHLDEKTVLEMLRPVLEDPSIGKVGQNLKYDWVIFKSHGITLNGIVGDSMIASYLADSARSSHGMNALAQALLDYRCIPISVLIGEKKRGKSQKTFEEAPLDLAVEYAAEDADISLRLIEHLEPSLKIMGVRSLYDDVEIPLVTTLAGMEYEGIRVDPDVLDAQSEVLKKRIVELRELILNASPREFNPDSPKQLAGVLFNPVDDLSAPGLGLKVIKKGKTGPSTDMEVLGKLADNPEVETPVPSLIVEYRQLTKLVGTYLAALKEYINPETGRIHASFNQTVAATGRLSSSDPNLQNIPIRTEVGRQIRKAFVASPGHKLITADYSQIELRILAHLSKDTALVDAFNAGEDIHRTVAAEVYNVAVEDVTGEQRSNAKMVNFGIVYGITAFGLARRLGGKISNEEAAKIISDYKTRFKGIDAFLDRCVQEATDHGFVETMLHRRRAIPQIASRNPRERMLGERVAINSVVQGSAADLIKIAMVNIYRKLPEACPGTRMLLQIHDELVFESPDAEVDAAFEFVVREMESAMSLRVPLKVGAEIADNWLEAK